MSARLERLENWTPAQNGRIKGMGAGREKNRALALRARFVCFFALKNREAVDSLVKLSFSQPTNLFRIVCLKLTPQLAPVRLSL